MRKHKEFLLIVLLCMTFIILGCSGSTSQSEVETNGNPNAGEIEGETMVTSAGTYTLVEDKVTISVIVWASTDVEYFETNEFTKWYEEKPNVHIEWELAPEQSAEEALNLTLASGDLPDIILNMGVSNTQQVMYGSQGLFLDLNDLISKY